LLLAKSFTSKIKKNLDPNIDEKLKLRLFKKYGLSIKQSIENFSKLDNILKEFMNLDSQKFEKDCLSEIININNIKKNHSIIEIKDKFLIEKFLEIIGDKELRKIREETSKKSLLISEILKICKLSQTSGYRKINFLIRNGFLIKTGYELTIKKRKISKYSMICKKINMEIQEDKYIIKIKISKNIFEDSTIIKTIFN